MASASHGRLRFLPISLGLGLFVGDVLTLLVRGELTLGRAAVSALISIVIYYLSRWLLRRRHGSGQHG